MTDISEIKDDLLIFIVNNRLFISVTIMVAYCFTTLRKLRTKTFIVLLTLFLDGGGVFLLLRTQCQIASNFDYMRRYV